MGWFLPLLSLTYFISTAFAYPPAHAAFFRRQATTGPQIAVENGIIEGREVTISDGKILHAFEGIPYAERPDRLEYPVKKKNWEGVLYATKTPPRCLQLSRGGLRPGATEDCLFLSVIAPKKTSEQLPVIVVVHGGAFSTGGVEETNVQYVAQLLAVRGVIVVPIQYRTGPLGFCSTGDSVIRGNYGLFDVKMAFEWVRDNIADFGGNPDAVTAYGGSAGAALIDSLLLNEEMNVMINNVIIWSGAGRDLFKYNITASCKAFMESKQFDTSTKEKMKQAILDEPVNSVKLASGWHKVTEDAIKQFSLEWAPVWDDNFFKGNLKEKRQKAKKKPMIIGMADLEGAGFTSMFSEQDNKTSWENKLDLLLDTIIPENHRKQEKARMADHYIQYAQLQTQMLDRVNKTFEIERVAFQKAFGEAIMGSVVYDEIDYYRKKHEDSLLYPIFLYDFKWFSDRLWAQHKVRGAFHGMDQWYSIDSNKTTLSELNHKEDHKVIYLYTHLIINFAKYSDPNGKEEEETGLLVKWLPINSEHKNRNYQINTHPSMVDHYYHGYPEKIRNWALEMGTTDEL